MRRWLPVCLLLACGSARAVTVAEIVERNRQVLAGVTDFSCLMTFTVRSTDIRVPDTRIRIYFKKPDRFKPEAVDQDFAVLPNTYRFAIGNVLERLVEEHRAVLLRSEERDGRRYHVLKMTPKEAQPPLLYHLIEVDAANATVSRMTSYLSDQKPSTVALSYEQHGSAWLPAGADIIGWQKRKMADGEEWDAVRVGITFTRYKLNLGLKDSFFDTSDRT